MLETGQAQPEAIALYRSTGYYDIAGFGHYCASEQSVHLGRPLGRPLGSQPGGPGPGDVTVPHSDSADSRATAPVNPEITNPGAWVSTPCSTSCHGPSRCQSRAR